ncbi:MAG: hypothetical protein GTN81_13855 [Proteobacteria bacterium]|nr:hypothetical protein [Pseudomonadota bacterium]
MRTYIHILILVPLSPWLIWSGVRAIKTRKACFGRGYRRYAGRNAVYLGCGWIAFGSLLLLDGLIVIWLF